MVNTNNPNLDLFIKMVRQINRDDLEIYLEKSWEFDKLKTIAIIFNSRDRINGKKEKMISNYSMLWLKKNHNNIYKKNIINYINLYGCWNDLNFFIKFNKKNNYEYKLFSEQLLKDIEILNNDEIINKNISLCSKWVISPNHKDVIKIARYLFNNELKNYQERYRKEIIKPLRTHLDLLETKLCNKNYEEIDYKKIPAKALSMYVKSFKRNDAEKYQNYLNDVKNNKVAMKITGLLPHEIIKKYIQNIELIEIDETLELQWKTFVNNFKNEYYDNYDDIIPIVDVSGSMFEGTGNNNIKPIYVSVALGLFLSELNRNELHNKVITFTNNPKFFEIRGETLKDRIKCLLNAPFGLNTNFLKVADLIINNSIYHKRIICFTDMQFDSSYDNSNYSLQDIHNLFMSKFTNNNYEKPTLIYWNLNGKYNDCPINNDMENTSIISGFSEQLLKIILKTNEISPVILMEEIIKPYYDNIILI